MASISMMPWDVVIAHDENSFSPTQYRLSNTFIGSMCQFSRAGAGPGCGGVVGCGGGLPILASASTHRLLNMSWYSVPAACLAAAMCFSGVSAPCAKPMDTLHATASAAIPAVLFLLVFIYDLLCATERVCPGRRAEHGTAVVRRPQGSSQRMARCPSMRVTTRRAAT